MEAPPDLAAELARVALLIDRHLGDRASSGNDGVAPESARVLPPGLKRCAAIFRLTELELDVLALALAVELEPGVAARLAQLQGDPARRRPQVGTVLQLLAGAAGAAAAAPVLAVHSHLVRTGLVELVGDGPHPDRFVRIPDSWWPRLAGLPGAAPFAPVTPPAGGLGKLVLTAATRASADRALARARAAVTGPGRWWLSGAPGCGRSALALALADALGLHAALRLDAESAADPALTPHLAREVVWQRAALLIEGAPPPGALARLADELAMPIAVIAGAPVSPELDSTLQRWTEIAIEPLSAAERARVWRDHLGAAPLAPDVDLDGLAARQVIGPARIAAAVGTARRHTSAHGEPITPADLRAACRAGAAELSGLAQWLDADVGLDALVLPTATRRELELALTWARRAPGVFHPGGAGRQLRGHPGLVCLFHGPPGTGKTLAAQVMATAVGAGLLRVDLSRVVNKYIGETEKNLARVFDEAEATGAVLFFDEADALFSHRTEVRDAHDRYANLETAYLLQRIEQHRGICVLASNMRQQFDDAFTRRTHVIAEFPLPGRDERRRIWALQLPADALAADVDLQALADRIALAGGDIRNAAATAAVLAAEDGTPISMRHLVIGTWRELRKAGRLVTSDDFGPWKAVIQAYSR